MSKRTEINIGHLAVIVPGLCIFFGLIYLYAYLNHFKLSATNYFSYDELLIFFIPFIHIIIQIGLFVFLFYGFLVVIRFLSSNRFLMRFSIESIRDLNDENPKKQLAKILIKFICSSTGVLTLLVIIISNLDLMSADEYFSWTEITGILLIMLIGDLIQIYREWNPDRLIDKRIIMIIFSLILFVNFVNKMGRLNAIANEKAKHQVSFVFENKPYHTTQDLICVLNSKNYIILRNLKTGRNQEFEKDKITRLTLRD